MGTLLTGSIVMEANAGVLPVELEGELVVPVEGADLAGLQLDGGGGAGDGGGTDVGDEGFGVGGSGCDGLLEEQQAARFGADGNGGGPVAAEHDGDLVVSVRGSDGEEEGLVAGAGAARDCGWRLEVEAEGGGIEVGVGGCREEGCGRQGHGVCGGLRGAGIGGPAVPVRRRRAGPARLWRRNPRWQEYFFACETSEKSPWERNLDAAEIVPRTR